MEEEMIATSVTFPPSLLERIKKIADDNERPVSYIIRKAAEEFLAKRETEQVKPEPKKK